MPVARHKTPLAMHNGTAMRLFSPTSLRLPLVLLWAAYSLCAAQPGIPAQFGTKRLVLLDQPIASSFPLATDGHVADLYLAPEDEAQLAATVNAFASDIERVTGTRPRILHSLQHLSETNIVLIGIAGKTPELRRLSAAHKLDTTAIDGQWESALTTVVNHPLPGIAHALFIAGSDRRGTAFALFTLSRQMGVSPWNWWADVPVAHHAAVFVQADNTIQPTPSVQYRGIFLNDEDWGLRPWAAAKMDPTLHNIGPNTYDRIFELLLRLHANSLWPAMHPGTLAFNAIAENAKLADKWGIVMGSSHSEALLRNNVGEWSEAAPPKGDGPWNYQLNKAAMDSYWNKRVAANGKYENFYTVGLRGVHDTGLEATGDDTVKAHLVEQAMASQRAILAAHVNSDLSKVPQVIWLYKESLELYRAGMKVPEDVTLGWTDDNYGYIRQLPTIEEQKRPGGSGIYYHVSYWGFPHDYLWLCTTPPALIREELTKAYDHNARKYWVLNVGDLKPAELDIDYFMQLAVDEPAVSKLSERDFLERWSAEQFPTANASAIADVMQRYYQLNFARKPEFMGFNGYNDDIHRTDFNPNAWGDPHLGAEDYRGQNSARLAEWSQLRKDEQVIAKTLPPQYTSAFFELVGYPVEAAAAMNEKFLYTDQSFLYASFKQTVEMQAAATKAHVAYDNIQSLSAHYNGLEDGKWAGIMSSAPRERHVFEMPRTATLTDANAPLPAAWSGGLPDNLDQRNGIYAGPPPGFRESLDTVSIAAAHFTRKSDGTPSHWNILPELGISGSSVEYGSPGLLANQTMPASDQPWLDYDFTTTTPGPAALELYLLPTFPLDANHRLRFAASIDGNTPKPLDAGATGEWHEDTAPIWAANVLRNAAIVTLPLGSLTPGKHTLRLLYIDPGVIFEHLVLTFPGAPPAYPVPPETVVGP
jgi:hypothetical protein